MFKFKNIESKIEYRKAGCIIDEVQTKTAQYINLYIQITNLCNAHCKFCSNFGSSEIPFDKEFFFEIFDEIYKNKFINKVTFTGGEPTLNKDLVECINHVHNTDSNILIFLDTNASNLELIANIAKNTTSIALSRHHFGDYINNEIFGFKTSTSKELESLPLIVKDKINLRCNLIKDYIDNELKCQEYLDWANNIGINSVGFIKLMPYTDYAKDNFVDVDITKIPGMIVTKKTCRPGVCFCENYIYKGKKGAILIYRKETINKDINENTLVLSNNKLLLGFKGEVLYAK